MQDRRPQEVVKEIPVDVLNFQPETPVVLDRSILLKSLQTARRGSSPGPVGYTYEHFKALMDNTDAFALFFKAALEEVAEALTPREQMYTFLIDVYIVCQPERVHVLFDMLAGAREQITRSWMTCTSCDQGRRNPPSRRENEGVELVWSQAREHRRFRARRLATQRHHGFGDSFGIRGVHHREGREEVGR